MSDSTARRFRAARRARWDSIAHEDRQGRRRGTAYHRRLIEIYRHLVPPGSTVLELGCGAGDLLAALEPEVGVGIDFSTAMLELARTRHWETRFATDSRRLVAIFSSSSTQI